MESVSLTLKHNKVFLEVILTDDLLHLSEFSTQERITTHDGVVASPILVSLASNGYLTEIGNGMWKDDGLKPYILNEYGKIIMGLIS